MSTSGDYYESLSEASYDNIAGHIIRYIHDAVSHLNKKEHQPEHPSTRVDNRDDELGDQLTDSSVHPSGAGFKKGPDPKREGMNTELGDTSGSTRMPVNIKEALEDVFDHPTRASVAYTAFSCEGSQSADMSITGHSDKTNTPPKSTSPLHSNIKAMSGRFPKSSQVPKTQQSQVEASALDKDTQRLDTDVATPELTEDDRRKGSTKLAEHDTFSGNGGHQNLRTPLGTRKTEDVETNSSSMIAH